VAPAADRPEVDVRAEAPRPSRGHARALRWPPNGPTPNRTWPSRTRRIFEINQLIAALADVDGAVVLTRRFELIGLAAEMVGPLPHVEQVTRAVDLEGETRTRETPDDVGTCQRSVYRLIAAAPEVLAILVSQDGLGAVRGAAPATSRSGIIPPGGHGSTVEYTFGPSDLCLKLCPRLPATHPKPPSASQ
jgi:hypothetical protein